jgi:hypothetical protein
MSTSTSPAAVLVEHNLRVWRAGRRARMVGGISSSPLSMIEGALKELASLVTLSEVRVRAAIPRWSRLVGAPPYDAPITINASDLVDSERALMGSLYGSSRAHLDALRLLALEAAGGSISRASSRAATRSPTSTTRSRTSSAACRDAGSSRCSVGAWAWSFERDRSRSTSRTRCSPTCGCG